MDYLLWEISFANLNMLLMSIPSYSDEKEETKSTSGKKDTEIKAINDFFKST